MNKLKSLFTQILFVKNFDRCCSDVSLWSLSFISSAPNCPDLQKKCQLYVLGLGDRRVIIIIKLMKSRVVLGLLPRRDLTDQFFFVFFLTLLWDIVILAVKALSLCHFTCYSRIPARPGYNIVIIEQTHLASAPLSQPTAHTSAQQPKLLILCIFVICSIFCSSQVIITMSNLRREFTMRRLSADQSRKNSLIRKFCDKMILNLNVTVKPCLQTLSPQTPWAQLQPSQPNQSQG